MEAKTLNDLILEAVAAKRAKRTAPKGSHFVLESFGRKWCAEICVEHEHGCSEDDFFAVGATPEKAVIGLIEKIRTYRRRREPKELVFAQPKQRVRPPAGPWIKWDTNKATGKPDLDADAVVNITLENGLSFWSREARQCRWIPLPRGPSDTEIVAYQVIEPKKPS